jgi:hypothetical protein
MVVLFPTRRRQGRLLRSGDNMRDTWETTVRTAASTMLRYSEKLSDGLEAELYALLEQLGAPKAEQPVSVPKQP